MVQIAHPDHRAALRRNMFEEAEIEMPLQYVAAHSDNRRNIATKPALWFINPTREAHALTHVAIAKSISVPTDKIEFVERMNNRYLALCGCLPAVNGEV